MKNTFLGLLILSLSIFNLYAQDSPGIFYKNTINAESLNATKTIVVFEIEDENVVNALTIELNKNWKKTELIFLTKSSLSESIEKYESNEEYSFLVVSNVFKSQGYSQSHFRMGETQYGEKSVSAILSNDINAKCNFPKNSEMFASAHVGLENYSPEVLAQRIVRILIQTLEDSSFMNVFKLNAETKKILSSTTLHIVGDPDNKLPIAEQKSFMKKMLKAYPFEFDIITKDEANNAILNKTKDFYILEYNIFTDESLKKLQTKNSLHACILNTETQAPIFTMMKFLGAIKGMKGLDWGLWISFAKPLSKL